MYILITDITKTMTLVVYYLTGIQWAVEISVSLRHRLVQISKHYWYKFLWWILFDNDDDEVENVFSKKIKVSGSVLWVTYVCTLPAKFYRPVNHPITGIALWRWKSLCGVTQHNCIPSRYRWSFTLIHQQVSKPLPFTCLVVKAYTDRLSWLI